jgi:hypothetical protein
MCQKGKKEKEKLLLLLKNKSFPIVPIRPLPPLIDYPIEDFV